MSLAEKSIEQLTELNDNLLRNLKNINPNASPDNFETKTARLTGIKRFILETQINALNQKIFDEYKTLVDAEEKRDMDKSVEYMNQYIISQAVPYLSGIKSSFSLFGSQEYKKKKFTELSTNECLQKWRSDYKTWKKSKEKDAMLHFNLEVQFQHFYEMLAMGFRLKPNHA